MTITMIKTTAIDIDIAIIIIHYNDELDDNAKMITAMINAIYDYERN